jgi:anti-sigma factor RsiW
MDSHVTPLLSDYVLGLLSENERRWVESHAGQCTACREALKREQGVELLVRQTLQLATQPAPARLQALRPAAARRPTPQARWGQLAPAMMLLVLLAVSLTLQTNRVTRDLGFGAPVFYRDTTPTATSTSTPTATIAGLMAPTEPVAPAASPTWAIPTLPVEPVPATQPAPPLPIATPVAAIGGSTTN